MRIVVTGKTGQIVQALLEVGPRQGATIIPIGRPELNLALPTTWRDLLAQNRPDVIVSAAAYTAVDKAESELALAQAVNAEGPRALAADAAALGVPLIQISTDYVFDGQKLGPWKEDDHPSPINAYGASKLAGEQVVLAAAPSNIVLRVGWVYAPFGNNFVKTMLRLSQERKLLRIVADQVGGPTSAFDIAEGIVTVARNIRAEPQRADLAGVFHMGPAGRATWAEFAQVIFAWLRAHGGPDIQVEEIATADYPTPAKRPLNSCLDSSKLAAFHNHRLPHWRTSLPLVLERLV